MPTNKKKIKKVRPKKLAAERATSKATPAAMGARGKLINKVAPQSPIWLSNATIKGSGLEAIAACAVVEADLTDVAQLQIKLDAAKTLLLHDEVTAGSKLDVFFTNVEDVAVTVKEMQDLGVDPLLGHVYTLGTPLLVTTKSDPTLHDIAVRVKPSPGMKRCVIEVSADLTMATGVKTFPGDGLRQSMGPFPPGTYAVRACHTRASERSLYTEIVHVVVQ